jgi:hypothetical protein
MVARWLHFEELGGDPWVLPIYTAASTAVGKKKCPPLSQETISLGRHVATRLNVLPRVINRLNSNCQAIYENIKTHKPEHVFSDEKEGYTFRLDHDLKYSLIADINSFLFEVNSCSELITEFSQTLYSHLDLPATKEDILKNIKTAYKQAKIDEKWFALLDKNRNFVAHHGTPYIAVDISTQDHPELLIMKDSIVAFDNPDTFLTISDLNLISGGFTQTNALLQKLLIDLFK